MWTTDDTASDVEGILLLFAAAVLGAGMMVEVLKHTDTTAWEREMLKMSVHTSVSSVLQHPTREVIWACCFLGTGALQRSPHILRGHTEGQLTWQNSEPGAGGGVGGFKSGHKMC